MIFTVKSKLVYGNKWVKLYEDLVKNKDGKLASFIRLGFHDVVEVVPIFGDDSVLMVKNYRHGVHQIILELPAGYVEKNETLASSARRELLEETGYSCINLKKMGWYYNMPSRSKQKINVFVARGLKLTAGQNLDDFEDISVIRLSKHQVKKKIKNGEIRNSSVIAALRLAGF